MYGIRALWRTEEFMCGSERTLEEAYEYAARAIQNPGPNLVGIEILNPDGTLKIRIGACDMVGAR